MNNILIVILNYNSSEDTLALYNKLSDYQILVIDNCSTTKEVKLLEDNILHSQLIINSKNLGYAGGNNQGIKYAIRKKIPYVLILNPDISIRPCDIDALLLKIAKNNNIAAVGPRICYRNQPNKIYSDGGIVLKDKGFFTSHINYNRRLTEKLDNTESPSYVNGSVFLARTSVFQQIGLFDEKFFLYFEETDWCLRAKKANYDILVIPSITAFHKESKKNEKYNFYMIRNRLLLASKFRHYHYRTISVVLNLIWNQIKSDLLKRNKLSSNTKAKIKGFCYGILRI